MPELNTENTTKEENVQKASSDVKEQETQLNPEPQKHQEQTNDLQEQVAPTVPVQNGKIEKQNKEYYTCA